MAMKQYKRDLEGMEECRRDGMRMLARGVSQAEVARHLGVSRQAASSWAKKLAESPQAWRQRPLGRPAGLNEAQRRSLRKTLFVGPTKRESPSGWWTLALVSQLIERKFGVAFGVPNVHRTLREMGIRLRGPAAPRKRSPARRPPEGGT
ncbi:helix-turn-helix domain-containing protein [Cupriavidus pauculus]|uniref:Helix-turn-helix domain-containing protein n=1 Tax=Cupriavidus pauculus TaxID=82633 RepID=A0A5P2H4V1_9BURK|nr:helix-turn-helix domain-containing protein [Cupriavidus pauculus]